LARAKSGALSSIQSARVVSTSAFILMDVDEIRLLLKDQATAHQKQTNVFQAQIICMQNCRPLEVNQYLGWVLESVKNRFGPCKYEDSQGALSKLLQMGTIAQYQTRVVGSKPTSLDDALSLARSALLPTPSKDGGVNTSAAPLAIKWISPAERQERLSEGLCFNCDNKWVRGHKCPDKFLLVMADEEDDREPTTKTTQEDVVESGDILILNSLVGHGSPRSLQLWGSSGSGKVHILIDNCSTHNFVQPRVVERIAQNSKVTHGCGFVCTSHKGTIYSVGNPLVAKVGQGNPRLLSIDHGIRFSKSGYTLHGEEALRMKRISLHHMRALLAMDDIYRVYELYNMAHHEEDRDGKIKATTPVHPDIAQLLAQFESLFQVPTMIPPHRNIDHHIHLYPNMKLFNVRPYRYPHYLNWEMEKLVNEMLG
ncbi:hypothetical protein Tco_1415026, partial [Tanacetum coccineum]